MKKILISFIIIIMIGVLGFFFGKNYLKKYTYTKERADLNAYLGIEDEHSYPVIYRGEKSDLEAREFDGEIYIPFETALNMFNDRFYYGEADQKLFYCLPGDRVTAALGSDTWALDSGESFTESYQIIRQDEEEKLWMALPFLKGYANFSYQAYTSPNRLVLTDIWEPYRVASLKKDSAIRVSGGVKSEIVADLTAGTQVRIMEEMDNWSKVMTHDGLYGYIENKELENYGDASEPPVTDYQEPEHPSLSLGKKVNLAWHQIAGTLGNDTYYGLVANTKTVNVISPTWFHLNDSGQVESYAAQYYVDAAHSQGFQVWAVFDNFSTGKAYGKFLEKDQYRNHVIDSLIGYCRQYDIDGINIDIENLAENHGDDFIEFIRELSIKTHKEGLYLSVDNYVPYNFNDHYHMDEQGLFADYVILMGYDEHYQGSEVAGSVASIGYVTYGIQEALQMVPAEKLINGIPFYARVWTTSPDGVTSQACTMEVVQQYLANNGMDAEWSETDGQYYAERTSGDRLYQVWVEDERSIALKLNVMEEAGLAGVAEWCLGFETPAVWDVIADYMSR
ncbi:MAG: SH3 domain-containing protein [Lachnospiraceae bacterium]|nr:SH3 domain-containing protein [Lachnospiraceae bacterium]